MFNDPIVKRSKKKASHQGQYNNPYEALQEFGTEVAQETKEQSTEIFKEIIHELFSLPKTGDLKPGQELDLKAQEAQHAQQQEQKKSLEKHANSIRPGIDYIGEILKSNENKPEDEHKLKEDIQNLVMELKSLASSVQTLEKQITEATGHTVVNPGKYHKTFFRWLISMVQDARVKIDNAGVWLSATSGKQKGAGGKKKSQNYWDMAQKHGTKFTLSGERGISTQAG